MERINAAIGMVLRGDLILICQHKNDDAFRGFWEFPGGKREAGEPIEQCLARGLLEELNILVRPLRRLPPLDTNIRTPSSAITLSSASSNPANPSRSNANLLWIRPSELGDHHFHPYHQPMIDHLIFEFDFRGSGS